MVLFRRQLLSDERKTEGSRVVQHNQTAHTSKLNPRMSAAMQRKVLQSKIDLEILENTVRHLSRIGHDTHEVTVQDIEDPSQHEEASQTITRCGCHHGLQTQRNCRDLRVGHLACRVCTRHHTNNISQPALLLRQTPVSQHQEKSDTFELDLVTSQVS